MFLRDSGVIGVLERPENGQQRWSRCLCVIDEQAGVLEVFRSPLGTETLLKVPLGEETRVVEGRHGFVFKLLFDGRVVTFRVGSQEELDSWVASLKVLGHARELTLHPGFEVEEGEDIEDNGQDKKEEVVTSRSSAVHSEPPSAKNEMVPTKEAIQDINMAPMPSTLRKSCGYLFILAHEVSSKWRETFCVLYEGHLLEFAFPGDDAPLFTWKLRRDVKMAGAQETENGKMQIFVQGELCCTHQDKESSAAIDSVCMIHICTAIEEETYAWALSILESLESTGSLPTHLTTPVLTRYCARQSLRPFHVNGSLNGSLTASYEAALALSFVVWGDFLVKRGAKIRERPLSFLLFSMASPQQLTLAEMRRNSSIRLVRVEEKTSRKNLSSVGLEAVTYGHIQALLCSDGSTIETDEIGKEEWIEPTERTSRAEAFKGAKPGWPSEAFLAELTCRRAGMYKLEVFYGGYHIFGSPFRVLLHPGSFSAEHSTASGAFQVGPNEYEVHLLRRDAYLNPCRTDKRWKEPFKAKVKGPGQVVAMSNPHLQTSVVRVRTEEVHAVELEITVGDVHIRDSPIRLGRSLRSEQNSSSTTDLLRSTLRILEQAASSSTTRSQSQLQHHSLVQQDLKLKPASNESRSTDWKFEWKLSSGGDERQALWSLPIAPLNGLNEMEIRYVYFELTHLERVLSPLREVAEIELKGGREPSAEWKKVLGRWQHWSMSKLKNPSFLHAQCHRLRALEIALQKSNLPNREALVEHTGRVAGLLHDLVRRIRANH